MRERRAAARASGTLSSVIARAIQSRSLAARSEISRPIDAKPSSASTGTSSAAAKSKDCARGIPALQPQPEIQADAAMVHATIRASDCCTPYRAARYQSTSTIRCSCRWCRRARRRCACRARARSSSGTIDEPEQRAAALSAGGIRAAGGAIDRPQRQQEMDQRQRGVEQRRRRPDCASTPPGTSRRPPSPRARPAPVRG